MPKPKIWILSPFHDEIQIVQKDKDIRKYLHCDVLDAHFFEKSKEIVYGVYYDDEAMLKEIFPINVCAQKFLSQINMNWGTFNTYFVIIKYKELETNSDFEKEEDMDLSPDEFIKMCNISLNNE